MFSSGLRSSTMRSASLPFSSEPMSRVETEVARAGDRGGAQRLHRRHPALLQHPELPVRAQTLQLSVRAELDAAAGIRHLFRAARDQHVIEVGSGAICRRRERASITSRGVK